MGEESYVTVAQFNVEGGAATTTSTRETGNSSFEDTTTIFIMDILLPRKYYHNSHTWSCYCAAGTAGDTKHPGVRVR